MIKPLITLSWFALIGCFSALGYSNVLPEDSPVNLIPSSPPSSIYDYLDNKPLPQMQKQEVGGEFYNTVVLKILDKKLGKMDVVQINIKDPILYNDEIIIKTLACWKEATPRLFPDSKALVEFYLAQNSLEKVYIGWLFSNNPGISGYKTEKYEFIVDDCIDVQ